MFQSTPARDGRPEHAWLVNVCSLSFNPRPRATGDQGSVCRRCRWGCFNPRPRATGDRDEETTGLSLIVSIHARARRATAVARRQRVGDGVSIHARARRATLAATATAAREKFQSTPARDGRQRAGNNTLVPPPFQSTPARDGRRMHPSTATEGMGFNPRPRATGDGVCEFR